MSKVKIDGKIALAVLLCVQGELKYPHTKERVRIANALVDAGYLTKRSDGGYDITTSGIAYSTQLDQKLWGAK